MLVVTAEQMREMDRLTIQKHGVPSLTLMERAGEGITAAILKSFAAAAKKGVLIVAGKGNNGGDGFVVARLLKKKRIPCEVALLAKRTELSPDAAHNCRAFEKLRGKVTEITAGGLETSGAEGRRQGFVSRCDPGDWNQKRGRRALCRGDYTDERQWRSHHRRRYSLRS